MLFMECAKKLNFFPPKGGVSQFYSPQMILHQKALDYQKHCSIPFGSYVQAHTEPEPRNSQLPRTLDCIYLRYTDNEQGGHTLLDLRSGRLITRRNITAIPITQRVIDMVHKMAENKGIPNGCKIDSRTGLTLYDSSWIAGVGANQNHNASETEYETEDEISIVDMDGINEMDEMNPNETEELMKPVVKSTNPTGILNQASDDNVNEETSKSDNGDLEDDPSDDENSQDDQSYHENSSEDQLEIESNDGRLRTRSG
jgi:hypothetical protein